MEQTKEEILKWVDRADNFGGQKSVIAFDKVVEITATMYTHSEVLKIAEAVKRECIEKVGVLHDDDGVEYINWDPIESIDVNQFIPKKG